MHNQLPQASACQEQHKTQKNQTHPQEKTQKKLFQINTVTVKITKDMEEPRTCA